MMFGMNEVTSKIAYAYAKQSAFVVVAVALLAVTPSILYLVVVSGSSGWALAVATFGDLVLLAGAVAMLAMVFTRTDLHRINRFCLRIAGILFLVQLGCVIADEFGPHAHVAHLASETALAFFALAAVVSYPFPTRRGGTVLYDPEAVRRLANTRAAAMASLLLVILSLFRLLAHGDEIGFKASPISPYLEAGLLELLAISASGYFLIFRNRPQIHREVEAILVVALAVSFLLAVEDLTNPAAWALALGPVGIVVSALLVDFGLSRRLDTGRTIVAHRA